MRKPAPAPAPSAPFLGPLLGPLLAPLLALLLLATPLASGTPFKPDDNFIPACGGTLPTDPPPAGSSWLPWSDTATWGGNAVPGVGATVGANVTVPCGQYILLDVPLVQLTVLNIVGALKLLDSASLPKIRVQASFVIVEGRFIIGSAAQQFSQKAEITLLPNPNGRAPYLYTSRAPAELAYPRSMGHKAFAVVGGQVDFHGMPAGGGTLTWTKLVATAGAGTRLLQVKGDVSSWPVGAPLVVASTDFYPEHEDANTIQSIKCSAATSPVLCNITLAANLTYNHYGDPLGVPDGFGGFIDETAEVALLTRNIVVTGTDEAAPYNLEGGHFIVFMTNTPQYIEGVQYLLMGQQGVLGRYNIHFHLCGDQAGKSVIRKNLILHSKQRCIVIHATFNAVVDSNVAYNTSGHCFMIEEGGETGNTFSNNFGLRTRAVTKKIADDETDDRPSTFWVTNPNNNYINNAAGGSEDSGFWLELRTAVRGLSKIWAKLNQTVPISVTSVGTFSGNTAHSNEHIGFRAYPHGFMPRANATQADRNWDTPVWVEIGGFNLYKNQEMGALIHDSDHVVFSNSTFADNSMAIHMLEVQGINVTGHRIVGQSNNYGNPTSCPYAWGKWTCGPITGCAFPLAKGVPGREVTWRLANQSILGVVFDQNRQNEDGRWSNVLSNTSFSAFDDTCHVAAGVAVGKSRASFWNAGHAFRSLKFSTTTRTNKAYLLPKDFTEGSGDVDYSGEPAYYYALRDLDGSVLGSSGYLVANNPSILPPASFSPACTSMPAANAYACKGACYRTVQLSFSEPGFSVYPPPAEYGDWYDGPRLLGDWSYINVTRVEDGRSFSLEGNLREYGSKNHTLPDPTARTFPMSLVAGYTYEITVISGTLDPAFVPDNITVEYKDGPGCGQGLTLRLRGSTAGNYAWAVQPTDDTAWYPCPGAGVSLSASVAPATYRYVCSSLASPQQEVLELGLRPTLAATAPVILVPVGGAPGACGTVQRCGFVSTRSSWFYNQQNLDLHPVYQGGPAFYNPLYPTPAPAWSAGPGLLGYTGWAYPGIATFLQAPDWTYLRTFYFKTSFNLSRTACYSTLYIDMVVDDGVVLYLNNVELMRVNMPSGVPTNNTQALTNYPGYISYEEGYGYTTFAVPLTGAGLNYSLAEGLNHLAAEVHVSVDNGWDVAFAMRASAALDTSCGAPKVKPEVCDGVDNDNDGKVDVDPATGALLKRPCWSACGAGFETCIRGAYQSCSAPVVKPELCNNVDDNCDGLVDNGVDQLDCAAGNVCFAGKCQPVQDLTTTQPVWSAKAPGWRFREDGVDMGPYPSWKNGTMPNNATKWKSGAGDFGVFPANATWSFTTPLASNAKGNVWTRYFAKSFALTTADAAATYGYAVSLRRADGAVVYLNGRELFRSNMPAGAVSFTTLASAWSSGQNPTWPTNAVVYYPFGPLRSYGPYSVSGSNWISAELHGSSQWQQNWVFDLNLTRYITVPCAGGVTPCVRRTPVDAVLVASGDTWSFLDASLPLPPANWTAVSFNDAAWKTGATSIGDPSWVKTPMQTGSDVGNNRTTYYFRRTASIPDGACFFNVTLNVFCIDGAVVYINGAEASRFNMPTGNVTAVTPASSWPGWKTLSVRLSAGWLKSGNNVFAVELHQYTQTTQNYMLDFSVTGQREGTACTPAPL